MSLTRIYYQLLNHFGKQNWWPVTDRKNPEFEIMIGAILTQQTSWKQVEKAISALRKNSLLSPKALANTNIKTIEKLVKPSGFYKQKARRIANFSKYLVKNYRSNLNKLFNKSIEKLREELLLLEGVGKETVDNILLYAANKLIFPVDAYTFRIFHRLGLISTNSYDELQKFIQNQLPNNLEIYKEFRALIVKLGKTYCKTKPLCNNCPLTKECNYGIFTSSSRKS
jgi:endonuclease-3 related protein